MPNLSLLQFFGLQRDASNNITMTSSGGELVLLHGGASINEATQLYYNQAAGNLEVDVDNPGWIKDGSVVYFHSLVSGTYGLSAGATELDTSLARTVNGDPVYNPVNGDWTITLADSANSDWSFTTAIHDRIVLDPAQSANQITSYQDESGSAPALTTITIGDSGEVSVYVDTLDRFDAYISHPSATFDAKFYFNLPLKTRGWITPQMFGAGEGDDWLAFKTCFQFSQAYGGLEVRIPDGTYSIDTATNGAIPISLLNPVGAVPVDLKVTGSGSATCIIEQTGTGENLFEIDGWDSGPSLSGSIQMRDFKLDLVSGTSGNAIDCVSLSNSTFENLTITNFAGGAGIKFDSDSTGNSAYNRLVRCRLEDNLVGFWNDLSPTVGQSYCQYHTIESCVFIKNTSQDLLFTNSGGLAGKAGGHTLSDLNITGKTSVNSGIVISDDVGQVKGTNINIIGDGISTYLTLGVSTFNNFFDNLWVDGVILDSSDSAFFGRVFNGYGPSGDPKWTGRRRAKEEQVSANAVTIKASTEILIITTNTNDIETISDCEEGRRLDVIFTPAAPARLGHASGVLGVEDEIMITTPSPQRYKRYQLLGVADGTANRWYPSDTN